MGVAFLVALLVLGFAGVSGRVSTGSLTAPMVFVGAGLVLGVFGLTPAVPLDDVLHIVAELTLVVILFTDAAKIRLASLVRGYGIPLRLLAIGMPLTIVLGGIAAALILPGFDWADALLLAAILAPTDAALGQAVMTGERVPARIRQALSVESGLNDGIALPAIMILCAFAAPALHPAEGWSVYVALQLILGPLAGITAGLIGSQLVLIGRKNGWMSKGYLQISALALAVAAFAGAELMGGNGLIAAFVAGLTMGNSAKPVRDCLYEFAETEGELLMLFAFLLIGGLLGPAALAALDGPTMLYAVLSLTVVRIVPVALSLVGLRLRVPTILFLGWFGPRGLASVIFALVVVHAGVPAGHAILNVAVATVLLSIVLHGASAAPLAALYGRFAERARDAVECRAMLAITSRAPSKTIDPSPAPWIHFAGRLAIPLTAAPMLIGLTEGRFTWMEISLIAFGTALAYLHLYSELTRDA